MYSFYFIITVLYIEHYIIENMEKIVIKTNLLSKILFQKKFSPTKNSH